MRKTSLLAVLIAATCMPLSLSAYAADETSGASTQTASEGSSSTATATTGVRFKSGPTRQGRGVAFGRGHSGYGLNVSHASAAIANLPMDATESSISLFGELDVGVKVSKEKGKTAKVTMSNGNWYWTSWGIKGIESLGNGNAAIFTLQQAFKLNTGVAEASQSGKGDGGGGFNNQAFVGFQGGWGRLTFGHQAGLSSGDGDYSMLGGSAIGTGFDVIGDLAGVFLLSGWLDNSIAYRTQVIDGLQFTAMYSNGIDDDNQTWKKNSHYYGLGLTYDRGAFNSNIMWEFEEHKASGDTPKKKSTQYLTLGASYDFGPMTLYGAYQHVWHGTMLPGWNKIPVIDANTHATNANPEPKDEDIRGVNQNALSISVASPIAGGTAMLQLNGVKGKILATGKKYDAWSVGAAYTYPLSKRTLLYANANYGDGGKQASHNSLSGWSAVFGMATSF